MEEIAVLVSFLLFVCITIYYFIYILVCHSVCMCEGVCAPFLER